MKYFVKKKKEEVTLYLHSINGDNWVYFMPNAFIFTDRCAAELAAVFVGGSVEEVEQ